jgi:hypothetical protein
LRGLGPDQRRLAIILRFGGAGLTGGLSWRNHIFPPSSVTQAFAERRSEALFREIVGTTRRFGVLWSGLADEPEQ